MKTPLFRSVKFFNLHDNKKAAAISVRPYHSNTLIYVAKNGSSTDVVGYQDPETGLFVTQLRPDEVRGELTHNRFRKLAIDYAQTKIDDKLKQLSDLYESDKKAYEANYKPLVKIEKELNDYMADQQDFLVDLDKQIATFKPKPIPPVNNFLAFSDTELDDAGIGIDNYENDPDHKLVTTRLPYADPKNHKINNADRLVVENFLDVFVDSYNRHILAWYFGAMLSNKRIYDDEISKMMIVSSAHGGSGKSTLINSLSAALLTNDYREMKSSFDIFFMYNNRFGGASLLPLRLLLYAEADFHDAMHSDHNFDGLNISEIKSMIADGYLSREKKYQGMRTDRMSTFQIVLTNHPPVIDNDRKALNRRLIALVVKPSLMADKGEQLQMLSENEINRFISEHAQAFADYFVGVYQSDPTAFTALEYDQVETSQEIADGELARLKELNLESESLRDLRFHSVTDVLSELGKQKDQDMTALLMDIWAQQQSQTSDSIRWDNGTLYLDSSRTFYQKYKLMPVRPLIETVYGAPVKKFGRRMYKLSVQSKQTIAY